MRWIDTIQCKSRAHCRWCRTQPAWKGRAGYEVPSDFAVRCPFGVVVPPVTNAVSEPRLPSIPRLGYNFAKAVARRAEAIARGENPDTTQEEQERRLGLCGRCPLVLLPQWRCRHVDCGCWLKEKVKWSTESCPENCWNDPALLAALQYKYRTMALPPEPEDESAPGAPPKVKPPPAAGDVG